MCDGVAWTTCSWRHVQYLLQETLLGNPAGWLPDSCVACSFGTSLTVLSSALLHNECVGLVVVWLEDSRYIIRRPYSTPVSRGGCDWADVLEVRCHIEF